MYRYAVLLCFVLAGCATSPIDQFTHADLQQAAQLATKNGFSSRAQVWLAYDQLLTSAEQQAEACKAAIIASVNAFPTKSVGLATLAELSAEQTIGGTSAAVHAACQPLPLPALPAMPKP